MLDWGNSCSSWPFLLPLWFLLFQDVYNGDLQYATCWQWFHSLSSKLWSFSCLKLCDQGWAVHCPYVLDYISIRPLTDTYHGSNCYRPLCTNCLWEFFHRSASQLRGAFRSKRQGFHWGRMWLRKKAEPRRVWAFSSKGRVTMGVSGGLWFGSGSPFVL